MLTSVENKLRSILRVADFNHASRKCLYFILIMNVVSSAMVTIFIPGFSSAASDLHATQNSLQLTVVLHLVGEIIGRFLCGPLSDYVGKRNGLIPAVTLSIFGQLGCLCSNSIEMLMLMRFVQAIGSGVVYVVSVNYIACHFDGVARNKAYSTLEMYQPIANLTAPLFGSILCMIGGWRFIFLFLLIAQCLIRIFLSLYMPNDKPIAEKFSIGLLFKNYASIIRNTKFLMYAVIPGFSVGSYMIFSSHSPEIYHYLSGGNDECASLHIALIQSLPLLFNVFSTTMYRRTLQRYGLKTSQRVGAFFNILFTINLLLIILNKTPFCYTSLMLAMCIHGISCAFLVPASVTNAMECIQVNTGAVAASVVVLRNAIMSACISICTIHSGMYALLYELLFPAIFVLMFLSLKRIVSN